MSALAAAAGIGAGGNLLSQGLGMWYNYNMQKKAWAKQEALADKNRDWMERMSNTAHQREVDDLRAAGLNPLLSVNGGASASSAPAGGVSYSGFPPEGQLGTRASLTAAQIKTEQSKQRLNRALADKAEGEVKTPIGRMTFAKAKEIYGDSSAFSKRKFRNMEQKAFPYRDGVRVA